MTLPGVDLGEAALLARHASEAAVVNLSGQLLRLALGAVISSKSAQELTSVRETKALAVRPGSERDEWGRTGSRDSGLNFAALTATPAAAMGSMIDAVKASPWIDRASLL